MRFTMDKMKSDDIRNRKEKQPTIEKCLELTLEEVSQDNLVIKVPLCITNTFFFMNLKIILTIFNS